MKAEEEGMGEVNISAYESFISQTLQPRLEELLGNRDTLVGTKEEYENTALKLNTLLEIRQRGDRGPVIAGSSASKEDVGQNVQFRVDIGNHVFANAISLESINCMKIAIQDLKGKTKQYAIDEGLEYVQRQELALASKISVLEKQISEVVNDIESCLSNVHQLRALQHKDNKASS
jgi:hypothetical protein